MSQPELYLASQSPRRRELLTQVGLSFAVLAVDTDETRHSDEPPLDYVERVARNKVEAGLALRQSQVPVLAADTTVVCEGELYGKPVDQSDATRMLTHLAGRRHEVLTAVAVADGERLQTLVQTSQVTMAKLSPAAVEAYWQTGEPQDKAGGYGIQGVGAAFVAHLEGSFSGVMGLPLYNTLCLLDQFGVSPLTPGGIQ